MSSYFLEGFFFEAIQVPVAFEKQTNYETEWDWGKFKSKFNENQDLQTISYVRNVARQTPTHSAEMNDDDCKLDSHWTLSVQGYN